MAFLRICHSATANSNSDLLCCVRRKIKGWDEKRRRSTLLSFEMTCRLLAYDSQKRSENVKNGEKCHSNDSEVVVHAAAAMEVPECPVCLQSYDGEYAIPRVLACGHSVCETCLTQLPQKFPLTIRCPECTQLVKYPSQGPSAFPKNIDLLRLIISQNPNPNPENSLKPHRQVNDDHHAKFIPNLWSDEFYASWRKWVLPNDAVLVEPRENAGDDDEGGLCSVLQGRIGAVGSSDFGENQKVSLVRVVSLSGVNLNEYVFNYGYVAKVLKCLSGMKAEERSELDWILRLPLKQRRIGKILGLWGNLEDGFLYLVCECHNEISLEKLGTLGNGFGGKDEDGIKNDGMPGFAMIVMEISEAMIGLHSEGLITGCLSLPCFNFDEFGRVYIDLNEVLVTGRKVYKGVVEAVFSKKRIGSEDMGLAFSKILKSKAFVSPELFFELLDKEGIEVESGSLRYSVGYSSDVWSLACVLLEVLIGEQFIEELVQYTQNVFLKASEENSLDYSGFYMGWMEKVNSLLGSKFGVELITLQQILSKCLNFDPQSRPSVSNVWKCIRELIISPQFDFIVRLDAAVEDNSVHCLVLGDLCQLPKQSSETEKGDELQGRDDSNRVDRDHFGEAMVDKDFGKGVSEGNVNYKEMHGHLDCVTGLAIGGGFLFSSSFDKTVHVWSLQDFSHTHSFKGHEHKVMAVVYVDDEQPMCISGDSGGGICIWGISIPLGQEPLKKWYEEKDWRYSGIHALAVSGNRYLYTGSGDKSIKAWLLQDYTLSCTMNGHKSIVSTLAVCDGVLYSGSWDGTIRLWCLSDHSPLTVLGEDTPESVTAVLSLAANRHMLVAAHENGCIKMWRNDVFVKSTQTHNGGIFAVGMEGKWLFTGGWDKTVNAQELSGDEFHMDARLIGSVSCGSVITTLLCWRGKLFVGSSDRLIKVYYHGN